jgi:hypothetical protein
MSFVARARCINRPCTEAARFFTATSSLQVRMDELLYPAQSGMPQKDIQLLRPCLPPETEGLEHHIHPDLVAASEAVRHRLLWIVDADGNAIELVSLDALVEGRAGEPVEAGGPQGHFADLKFAAHVTPPSPGTYGVY